MPAAPEKIATRKAPAGLAALRHGQRDNSLAFYYGVSILRLLGEELDVAGKELAASVQRLPARPI